ncbi:hypothetical protein PVAND_000819 [Polypedilum vanderplanki]|uniref:RRM domain-containing protein n=1 Tax=Polypedilum vanderplanki TaxID=319348 RepID=A0A9J6BLC7_POLVA|nr:hypothetical protein PVAND_000819 [Polypedilum vanderplanki]
MSRDNHLQRSRSRSLSRYRNYNSTSKSQRTTTPPQFSSSSSYRYNSRHESPPSKRSRYQKERSRSFEKNGSSGGRTRRRNSPATTDISRKNHEPSRVLGVFNLHVRTTEDEIREVFERFGEIDNIVMVKDAKTRGFRGYCFLYYNKQRDATAALEECNGIEIKDRQIRVDYSLSEGPHVSTPGEYRGKRGRDNMRGQRPRHLSPLRGERTRYYDRYDNVRTRSRDRDRYDNDRFRRSPPRNYDRSDYHRRGSPDRFDRRRSPPMRERRH